MPWLRVRQAASAGVGALIIASVAGCGRQTAQAPPPASPAPAAAPAPTVAPAPTASAEQSPGALAVGTPAPEFATTTTAGRPLSLKSLRGKVVLLDYWATWCGPCKMSMPTLESLHKKFGAQGLKVVGLSLDDPGTVADVPAVARQLGVTYTIAASPQEDNNAGHTYGVTGIPAQFLIDKKGVLRWSQDGFSYMEGQQLTALIQKLLAEPA